MLYSCLSIYRPLPSHRYNGPIQVPPAASVSVEIIGYGKNLCCLLQEVWIPRSSPPLTPPPLYLPPLSPPQYPLYQATLCPCPHRFRRSPIFRIRTATVPDGLPIDILVPIGDVIVTLRFLVGSVYFLSGRCHPLISSLLVILVLLFFLL